MVVYGDTNSTLAGALAAAKLNIPVAHVEAGLRSFNRRMPEEINRIVADSVSELLLAPTDAAVRQLAAEGVPDEKVVWTGDLMLDVAMQAAKLAEVNSEVLIEAGLEEKAFYLATFHRAENTDSPERLRALAEALMMLAEEVPVALPLHPRTRVALEDAGLLGRVSEKVAVLAPLGFVDMVRLEMSALAILTDSGGVQKEAFFHGVPCFVLREETEWTELIDLGWNRLLPPDDPGEMVRIVLGYGRPPNIAVRPYGDGNAARLICSALKDRFLRG